MALTYLENARHKPATPWTDERTAQLARFWSQGLSASAISDCFNSPGITRNSVIGKANRLKLPARQSGFPGRPQKAKAKPKWKPAPKPPPPPRSSKPPASPPTQTPPVMRALQLVELGPTHCRFPVGDPQKPGFFFCAADVGENDNYCPFHRRMAGPK
jgi:GcrA cell cycle regulator